MYLCIEGLDGSGKTTLFSRLKIQFESIGVNVVEACPTRPVKANSFIERAFEKYSTLKKSSFFRAIVYGVRSRQTVKIVNWESDLILGDRSIITSYVTRWRKWMGSEFLTKAFVQLMEPTIPAPDLVLYLDLSPELLHKRIENRCQVRDIDENRKRSMQMRNAYKEIMDASTIKRLKKTKWICLTINESDSPETVYEKSWQIIKQNTQLTSEK